MGRECYPAPMTSIPISNVRNFAIVAHIDHGKSTLADRLIQITGGLQAREMKEQVLDSMDIERERGITIKAQTVRLTYAARDGKTYILNLIDTPGHVDFAYEVSRSLAACEGSLLVVDASQGVEAQTLANVYHALDAGHEIVPVLNKIDLPAAEPDQVRQQIEDVIGIDASDAVMISAKTGIGIEEVLEAIVHRLPAPKGDHDASLKALLVDSWYDVYLGVVVLVRIVDGVMKKGQRIRMMGTNAAYDVERVGFFTPKMTQVDELGPGEIGFITAAIKEVADTRVGDTITDDRKPVTDMLPGFKPAIPVVFCGLFPVALREDERAEAADTGDPKRRRDDAVADVETRTARDEAAGVDEQRGAVRKPEERRVALPHVEKRHVEPAVARGGCERPGLGDHPDGSAGGGHQRHWRTRSKPDDAERPVVDRDTWPTRRGNPERRERRKPDEIGRPDEACGAHVRDQAARQRQPARDEHRGHDGHAGDLRNGHQRNRQEVQGEAGERDARKEHRADRHQQGFGGGRGDKQRRHRREEPWKAARRQQRPGREDREGRAERQDERRVGDRQRFRRQQAHDDARERRSAAGCAGRRHGRQGRRPP